MLWFSPRTCVYLTLPTLVVVVGCGRLGFDPLSFDRDTRPSAADDDQGDASAVADEPGAVANPDSENDDAGSSSEPPDAGKGSSPPSMLDAGVPPANNDAGVPKADASVAPTTLEPLPTNVDCTSVTGLIACDSFSGSQSGVPVSTRASGGGVAITNDFFTGAITQEMTSANVAAEFNALTGGSVFLRFSLFVPGGFGIQGLNVASLGNINTGGDFGLDLNVLRDGQIELKTSGDGAVHGAGAYLLPRNRWLCVLVKIDTIANSGGSARVLIDGQEKIAATNVDTEPSGGITGASAGIDWSFNQQEPATLHVDNFVVTREHPSACP